jgi:hypothetical protein
MNKTDFPKINYHYWLKNYSWEGFSSMRGMITTMNNKKYIDNDINEQNITERIKLNIQKYNSEPNDVLLFEILKLIQTWGGKSAGRHTLSIVQNWDKEDLLKYKVFVDKINSNNTIDSFNYLVFQNKIKGLSYSFVPKHICFWSGNGDRLKGYPILDDVISILVYNTKSAKNVSYGKFIEDISEFAIEINKNFDKQDQLSLAQIEMAIFSFSGYYWKTRKTATSEFKITDLKNHIDFEEAVRISKRNLK